MSSIVYPLLGESVLSEGGTGSLRNSFLYKYRGDGTGEIIIELDPGESYVASVSGDQNEALNKWLSDVNLIQTIITNLANTYNGSKVEIADPISAGNYKSVITPLSVSEMRDVYWRFGPGAPYITLPVQPGTNDRQAQFIFEAPTTYYVSIDNGVQASDVFTNKAYMRRVTSWDFDTSTPTESEYNKFLDNDFAYSTRPQVNVIGEYGFDEPVYGRLYKVKVKGLPTWIDDYLQSSIIDQYYQAKNSGASPPYVGPWTEEDLIYIPIIANVFTEEIENTKLTKADRNDIEQRIKGQIDVLNQCLSGESVDFSNIDPIGNATSAFMPDVIGLDKDGNEIKFSDGKSFLDLIDHGVALPYRFKLMQKIPKQFVYPFFTEKKNIYTAFTYNFTGYGSLYPDTRKPGVSTIDGVDPTDYELTETINGVEFIDCGKQGSILFYDYGVWKNKSVSNLVARHSGGTTLAGTKTPTLASLDMFNNSGALVLVYKPYNFTSTKLIPQSGVFTSYFQQGKTFAGTDSPIDYDSSGLTFSEPRDILFEAICAQLNNNSIGQTMLHEFVHAIGWAGHTHHASSWSYAKETVGTNLRVAYFKTPFTPEFPYIDSDGNERTMALDWQDNESDWNTYAELIYSLPERYDIFNNKIKLKDIPQTQYITTTETETTTQIIAGESKGVGDDHEGGIIVHIDHENQRTLILHPSVKVAKAPFTNGKYFIYQPGAGFDKNNLVNELYGGQHNTEYLKGRVKDEACFINEISDVTLEGYNDWYFGCQAEAQIIINGIDNGTLPLSNYGKKASGKDANGKYLFGGIYPVSNLYSSGSVLRYLYITGGGGWNGFASMGFSSGYNGYSPLLFRIGSYPQGDQTIVTTEEIEVEIENPEYDSTLLETENTLTYESINIRQKITEALLKAPLFFGGCNTLIDGSLVNVINPANDDGTRKGPNITVKIPFCDAEDNTKYDFDWWLNFGFLDPEKPAYPNNTPVEDILSSELCPCLYLPQTAEDSGYDIDLTVINGNGEVSPEFDDQMKLIKNMVSDNFVFSSTAGTATYPNVKYPINGTGKVFKSTILAPPAKNGFENIIKTLNGYKVYNASYFTGGGLWTGISPRAHMPYKYRHLDKKLDTTARFNRRFAGGSQTYYDHVDLSDYEKEFIDSCKFNEDPSGLARGTAVHFGNVQEQSEGIEYALLYTIGSSNPSDDTYNPFRRDEFFTDPEYWGSLFGVATSAGFTKTQGVEFYDGVVDINYQLSAVKYKGAPIVFREDSDPNDLLAEYTDVLTPNYTDSDYDAYMQSLPMYQAESFSSDVPGYPSIYGVDSRVIMNKDAALFFDLLVKKSGINAGYLKGIRTGEIFDLKNREYTQKYNIDSDLQIYIEKVENYVSNYLIDGVKPSETSVVGCADPDACNYVEGADITNSLLAPCFYPEVAYVDCDGNCLNDEDGDGVCDEEDSCVGDIDNCGRCISEAGYQVNSCVPVSRTLIKTCVKDFLNVEEVAFLCESSLDLTGVTNIDGGELEIITTGVPSHPAEITFLEGFELESYWVKTPDLSTEEWDNNYYNAFGAKSHGGTLAGYYTKYLQIRKATYDCPSNPYVPPSADNNFRGGGGCVVVHSNEDCEYGDVITASGCTLDNETSLEELQSTYGVTPIEGEPFATLECATSSAVLIGLNTAEGVMFTERGEDYSGEFFYQSNASFYSGTPTNVGERLYPRNELLRKNLIAITKVDKIVEDFRKIKDKINKICTFTNRK